MKGYKKIKTDRANARNIFLASPKKYQRLTLRTFYKEMYMSIDEIASMFDLNHETIRSRMVAFGIRRRRSGPR